MGYNEFQGKKFVSAHLESLVYLPSLFVLPILYSLTFHDTPPSGPIPTNTDGVPPGFPEYE